jgi:hypothetical protein
MTPATVDRALYRQARAAGMRPYPAAYLARPLQRDADPFIADIVDRVADAIDYAYFVDLQGETFGVPWRVVIAIDEWADCRDWLGTFTDDDDADTVPNPEYQHGRYKFFRPEYSLEERYADARRAGMTRDAARRKAYADACRDARMAADYLAVVVSVDVDGHVDALGGTDITDLPGIPYAVKSRSHAYGVLQAVADVASEAAWAARTDGQTSGQLELIPA